MATDAKVTYPALLVETEGSEWTMYKIVHGPRGYVTFSRVLLKQQYGGGKMFDSSGVMHTYAGTVGWPQLNPGLLKNIIEIPMIYPILLFLFGPLFGIGPRRISSTALEFEDFRNAVVEHLGIYNSDKEIARLADLLDNGDGDLPRASDAASVVTWVERWNTMLSLEGYDDWKGAHIDSAASKIAK